MNKPELVRVHPPIRFGLAAGPLRGPAVESLQ
jgi:hypothetical protein